METKRKNSKIVFTLNNDEALVLLAWLSRFNEDEHPLLFEDQAEERVLFDLEALLEREVVEIFNSNYDELLSRAREKLRDKD